MDRMALRETTAHKTGGDAKQHECKSGATSLGRDNVVQVNGLTR